MSEQTAAKRDKRYWSFDKIVFIWVILFFFLAFVFAYNNVTVSAIYLASGSILGALGRIIYLLERHWLGE
jgi:hypothetical protein